MALSEDDGQGDAPQAQPAEETPVVAGRRVGSRPKVHAQRELRRIVFRESLVARGDEKIARQYREERPVVRGDCAGGQRPCPWVGCKYHLYLSVNPESGAITLNFPDLQPWELEETCALDVAEHGGVTLERVGELTNLTRERIRQVEVRSLLGLKRQSDRLR